MVIALVKKVYTKSVADSFKVNENLVIYDIINSEVTEKIDYGNAEKMLETLKTNENIRVLILNSEYGFI